MRRRAIGLCCAVAFAIALLAPSVAAAASGWTLTQLPARTVAEGGSYQVGLSGVSCPGESLCVAVGGYDTVVSSRAPTAGAGAWHVVTPAAPQGPGECTETNAEEETVSCGLTAALKAVSCASESLCVVVSWEGFAYVSTEPAGGASAWTSSDLNEGSGGDIHLSSVSCPSASLCVAVSTGRNRAGPVGGKVFTTSAPTSGHWQAAQLDSSLEFSSVSCGSPTLCVAVAEDGRLAISTEPTGGAGAWHVVAGPAGAAGLGAVGCAGTSLCVAGDAGGNLATSTEPGRVGSPWKVVSGGGKVAVTGASCLGSAGCVAVDDNGDVLTSAEPGAAAASWGFENLVPFHPTGLEGEAKNALFGASCASPSLCVLVGSSSRIFTATAPFSAAAATPKAGPAPGASRRAPLRPRTFFRWKERSWRGAVTRRRRVRANFRFYARTQHRGFECREDSGRWRRCRSPFRYWVGHGRHVFRVRAIGPTGLRGPAALTRFVVSRPRRRVIRTGVD
jgi:hypothetical protein